MEQIEKAEALGMLPLIKYLVEQETDEALLKEVHSHLKDALLKLPTHKLPAVAGTGA